MNGIGKPEKVTQDRVVKLFVDELGYKYLGEWRDRVGNSNIEKKLLESYLEKRGYSAPQIVKALYTLQSLANRPHRSLYDNNKAVYGLLRYGVNVKVESQTLGSVEPGGLSIFNPMGHPWAMGGGSMSELQRAGHRGSGMMRALFGMLGLVVLLGLAAPGCLYPGDDCGAEPIPLEGSLSDYTTTAGEVGDVTLHDPAPCKEDSLYGGGHLIAMEGHGDALWDFRERSDGGCSAEQECTADQSIFAQSVRAVLDEANIEAMAGFGDACQAQVPTCAFSYFHIRDWKLADQTVAIVLEKMALFELGECAAVLVAPEPVLCPD